MTKFLCSRFKPYTPKLIPKKRVTQEKTKEHYKNRVKYTAIHNNSFNCKCLQMQKQAFLYLSMQNTKSQKKNKRKNHNKKRISNEINTQTTIN